MYCAWRIPAHQRCTQCSILLHLMDICFLTCICLWQISQIQTFLFKVVGPGLVSTSPAFVSSSASHPAGPHGRHAQKTVNRAPIAGGGEVRTQFAQQLETTMTAPPLVGCVVWSLHAQSLRSSQTTSRDAKPTQHLEIIHHHTVNSKMTFHKVASFHQHYSTFTLQTCHHSEHRFRSCHMQMPSPSHLHTHTSKSAAKHNIHNVFAWTRQNNHTLNPDKTNYTLFTPDLAEYKSNLDLKINNTYYPWQCTQRFWALP